MPDFGTVQLPNINPMLAYYGAQEAGNRDIAARNASNLATATLGSNTQIAANTAEGGSLANQFAAQENPLLITGHRQLLGLEPSPNLDRLQQLYNGGGGASSGPAATGTGGGSSPNVPAEYLPFYQEASKRTGIPVDVLIAQGKQESGFNPGATGGAGEIGIHQILPSTARDPGYGMTGVDPATMRDPRTNINFAADYLKARAGPRTDFSNPATVNAALVNYNGGGDPNYVANVRRHMPGVVAPVAGPVAGSVTTPPVVSAATTSEPADLPHHGPDPAHTISVAGVLADQILAAPPEQRAALYQQLLPQMRQTGANVLPDYPGDAAIHRISQIAHDPDQRAAHLARVTGGTPAPEVMRGPPAVPPLPDGGVAGTQFPSVEAATAALGAGYPDVPDAPPPVQVAGPGAPTGAAPVAAGPRVAPIPNENPMLAYHAPMGAPLDLGQNAALPSSPVAAPVAPVVAAQAPPTAPSPAAPLPPSAPVAQPGTGMNSPQVQQAQELLRRATQIEMMAAQTPNDARAKATAAAMAADLKQRAGILMQADSVTTDPVTGIRTHSLTGNTESAVTPRLDYKPDPNNPGVLVSPGAKPVVLPPGRATTLPDGSTWVTGPGGTFKEVRDANLAGASAAATAAAGGTAAATSAAKTKDELIPLARTSVQAISNIDYGLRQLDEAAKGGIPTGYFAPALATAAAAAKSMGVKIPGVDPQAVSDIQTASKTLAVVSGAILQNIVGKGEITEGKIEAFIHAQPGITNDPLATHRILAWARSQFTYDHEMAMDGLANVDPKSGMLSPGWQAGYITKHGAGPIFDSVSGEMKQPDGRTPGREPPAEAPTHATAPINPTARTAGTTYQTPKGPLTWTGTGWLPAQ